jgi:acetylornithine deacetylase/succinyl-diaminopimelate desuccinylase-like protein
MISSEGTRKIVEERWEQSILPVLKQYITIPNKSPAFDAEWQAHGHMERALLLIEQWCRDQAIEGAQIEVHRLPGRTPLLTIDVPGEIDDTVLLYGHFDKQPEFTGWRDGLGPWQPVFEGERLYGRGGADDGYSTFCALTAIRALQEQRTPHARCLMLVEGCEESGSPDLPYYIEALADRIGTPSLVVCLDSGAGNYEQLWVTTSLRGTVVGDLSVELLSSGMHSGIGSGKVASTFRVARQVLDRVEDSSTGRILLPEFYVDIPQERIEQAEALAGILGEEVFDELPLLPGVEPVTRDVKELLLNGTWRPALSVIGAAGLPALADAGNVLRPVTTLKLSIRIPPGCDPQVAEEALRREVERDPPYNARVRFESDRWSQGWSAPATDAWLARSLDSASKAYFGREAAFMGEGGSIPFMAMLGERYPDAQFLVTGVLGPEANPHGPNEFLHLPTARRLTAAVAQIIADHARRD